MADQSLQKQNNITTLIELEQAVRRAQTRESLEFVIVNQTRRLISFDQAVFLSCPHEHRVPRVKAISNIATVDRTAPFVHWVERMGAKENKGANRALRHNISQDNLGATDLDDWAAFSPAHVLWLPLIAPQHGLMGTLWLARHTPWTEKEYLLLDHIAMSYAHGLQVFLSPHKFSGMLKHLRSRLSLMGLVLLCAAVMMIPVTLTALAPVEIVPKDPFVVASPMNGVVQKILVESNEPVLPGDIVARLDDTEVRNNVAVAVKALQVAQIQLEKAERGAFVDARNKEVLAELAAQVDLRRAEVAFTRERMNKSLLVSDKNGVAVVERADEWAGRPVNVGEKILQIADPGQTELKIMLPVKDAVLLRPDNRVRVFLDSDPLRPHEARVIRSEYEPHLTEQGTLAYRVTAGLDDPLFHPRIGLRGTAKVFGEKVTIFYYLFRRPITALRQWMGW